VPGLEDQVGADRYDFGAHVEGVHGHPLEVFDVAGGDVDEEVVGPGDEVDGAGVGLGEHMGDELVDHGAVVRAGPDGQEGLQRQAERDRVQLHAVAADDAGAAEPVDPVQAGGGGHSHRGGEVAVGGPGVVLQEPQNLEINRVENSRIGHLPNVARNVFLPAGRWPMLKAKVTG